MKLLKLIKYNTDLFMIEAKKYPSLLTVFSMFFMNFFGSVFLQLCGTWHVGYSVYWTIMSIFIGIFCLFEDEKEVLNIKYYRIFLLACLMFEVIFLCTLSMVWGFIFYSIMVLKGIIFATCWYCQIVSHFCLLFFILYCRARYSFLQFDSILKTKKFNRISKGIILEIPFLEVKKILESEYRFKPQEIEFYNDKFFVELYLLSTPERVARYNFEILEYSSFKFAKYSVIAECFFKMGFPLTFFWIYFSTEFPLEPYPISGSVRQPIKHYPMYGLIKDF